VVAPIRDAWFVDLIPGAISAGARNGFGEPRDWEPKSTLSGPQQAAETVRPVFEPTKMPANCGLFVRDRETPVRMGLRGGPERIRTSSQTIILIGDLVAKAMTELYTAVFRCGSGCVQLPRPPWMGS
jgi:hypothetical protein